MDEQKPQLPQEPVTLPESPTFGGQIPTVANPSVVKQKETDVLGIISIVLLFIFSFAGLIVGIVGIVRAKKHSYSPTLSIIGTALNGLSVFLVFPIMILLILTTFSGVQTAARDTERQTDIKALQAQLEVYYAQKGSYPLLAELNDSFWRQTNMPSLGSDALTDPRDQTAAMLQNAPTAGYYSYRVYEVDNSTPCTIASKCAKYTLTATLDGQVNGSNTFTRTSLN